VKWGWGNKPQTLPEAIPYQNSRVWMGVRTAIAAVGVDVILVNTGRVIGQRKGLGWWGV